MTNTRIKQLAESIYRIANFAPEDREQELTDMDKPGLIETEQALIQFAKEQDRDTRHACAEAVNAIAADPNLSNMTLQPVIAAFCHRAAQACMNTQVI